MNGGVYQGRRILSPAAVRFMTAPRLNGEQRRDIWDALTGYNYGCLVRVCDRPDSCILFGSKGEYGWDGWLGTYFANFPKEHMTILMGMQKVDAGTFDLTRKLRNVIL